MPGDYSRKTFKREKHYSGALLQQGRMLLDADWNEQWDIQQYRTEVEAIDVIGHAGVPEEGDSFLLGIAPDGTDLVILPGRIYVDGLLFELDRSPCPTSYFHQPYYPQPDWSYFLSSPPDSPPCSPPSGGAPSSPPFSPPCSPPCSSPCSPADAPPETGALNLLDGTYVAYLDGWQREITILEDPYIHEVALGEADTTTRIQNVWQVKLLAVTPASAGDATCAGSFPEWTQLVTPGKGCLQARTNPVQNSTTPCQLPPTAGYLGLENQLYRVEVQKGGSTGTLTFKWSRENASVSSKIGSIDGETLTMADLGKDAETLGFASGQWVEILDEFSGLQGNPYPLLQISTVSPAGALGGSNPTITLMGSAAAYAGRNGLRLRRWDQTADAATADGLAATGTWIDLENGIQVYFGNGSYNPGDFWLIPARTATARIEWPVYPGGNGVPLPRPPMGIKHHYCRLALLSVKSGQVVISDCRPLFPSLTDLELSDAAGDLREHNKYLHGTGVVCGLSMNCGTNRQMITLNPGYALTCEGDSIKIDKPIYYDLIKNAAQLSTEDGTVTVVLSGTSKAPVLTLEKYTPETYWEEVLDGTLLKDFYDRYILDLIQFAQAQLPFPLQEVTPVTLQQRRLTALINVLDQLVNPVSGPYLFISGVIGTRDPSACTAPVLDTVTEDQLLYCLYNDLKAEIASKTFCAMFDNDRPFPDYTIASGMSTLFGPPLKTHYRLRLSIDGLYAYTCGNDDKVLVYDLTSGQLVQILQYTGTGMIFQDIAIVPKDTTHFYAAGIVNNTDSVFIVITRDASGNHAWGNVNTVPGMKCPRLAFSPNEGTPYAVFLTLGVYRMTGLGTAVLTPQVVSGNFDATGLMAFNTGTEVIAASAINTGTGFSEIMVINPDTGGPHTILSFTGDSFNDDLLIYNQVIYCTGTSPAAGRVIGYMPLQNVAATTAFSLAPIENGTVFRLAAFADQNAGGLFLCSSDASKVVLVTVPAVQVQTGFRIPVQLAPMAMAVSPDDTMGYVLNTTVNTITAITFASLKNTPATGVAFLGPTNAQANFTVDPPAVLATYHQGVLNAYRDLFSHLLQYLKDSFCGEYLIDCPVCDGNEKIYLGSVEIRNRQVYKICNFTKRKYVKTFRTVDYWMSTIPLMPMIGDAFKRFCCTVINPK